MVGEIVNVIIVFMKDYHKALVIYNADIAESRRCHDYICPTPFQFFLMLVFISVGIVIYMFILNCIFNKLRRQGIEEFEIVDGILRRKQENEISIPLLPVK